MAATYPSSARAGVSIPSDHISAGGMSPTTAHCHGGPPSRRATRNRTTAIVSPTPKPRCRSSTASHHGAAATSVVACSHSARTAASDGSAGSSVATGTTRARTMGVTSGATTPMIRTARPVPNPPGPRATAPGV